MKPRRQPVAEIDIFPSTLENYPPTTSPNFRVQSLARAGTLPTRIGVAAREDPRAWPERSVEVALRGSAGLLRSPRPQWARPAYARHGRCRGRLCAPRAAGYVGSSQHRSRRCAPLAGHASRNTRSPVQPARSNTPVAGSAALSEASGTCLNCCICPPPYNCAGIADR